MTASPYILDLLAINRIPKIGPVLARQIIAYAGGVKEVFALSKKKLLEIPSIGPVLAQSIIDASTYKEAQKRIVLASFVRQV